MERRFDHYTAILIDTLLRMSEQSGIRLSRRSLLDLGISLDVADRVLSKPNERRRYRAVSNG